MSGEKPPRFILIGTEQQFDAFGGPLDDNPSCRFFTEFGHAISAFGRMEYLLTCVALHMNKASASTALHEPDPKAMFTELVKLVRKWLTQHSAYADLNSPESKAVLDAMTHMASVRNELVHSALQTFDESTGVFSVVRAQRASKEAWNLKTSEYNMDAIQALSDFSNLAHRWLVGIAKAICYDVEDQAPLPPD